MSHEFDGKQYEQGSAHQKEWGSRLISELNLNGSERILDKPFRARGQGNDFADKEGGREVLRNLPPDQLVGREIKTADKGHELGSEKRERVFHPSYALPKSALGCFRKETMTLTSFESVSRQRPCRQLILLLKSSTS